MELTQRLECTQDLYGTQAEKVCPEQVAFLGICGEKYPIKKGPNKIGRDPDTCNIILKLPSISRQHAVINVLKDKIMLMDLDSANKTKLENKNLDPYTPNPLRDGNTVQFGDVFGIFRLLEENDDLPMTQVLDIPDTPVRTHHVPRLNNGHITTVPESPDVSDRDDSFIVPTQPKNKDVFKIANNINKPGGKPSVLQQVEVKKINNVYWNSSRKSDSFSLQSDSSLCSAKNSLTPLKSPHKNMNSIHALNTQVSNGFINNASTDSLFTADTQMPEIPKSCDIYDMETQEPANENLPAVCKIDDQQNVNFSFSTDNKENKSIFEAETQAFPDENPNLKNNLSTTSDLPKSNSQLHDTSDDVIIFDEIESQPFEILESQPLLPNEDVIKEPSMSIERKAEKQEASKRNVRLKSDSSTDCEDIEISVSQNIRDKPMDDDVTDCEDELESAKVVPKETADIDDDVTDCEDELDDNNVKKCESNNKNVQSKDDIDFEDLPTQIIKVDAIEPNKDENEIRFEDMLTQVVIPTNEVKTNVCVEKRPQTIIAKEKVNNLHQSVLNTSFKVPISPLKTKKDNKISPKLQQPLSVQSKPKAEDDLYYDNTQDIFDDLCSQRSPHPQDKRRNLEDKNIYKISLNESSSSTDIEDQIEAFASSLSKSQINDCIGVVDTVDKIKKVPSDGSDIEVTPKKVHPITFMDIDLPDSQEIKSSMSLKNRNVATVISSDSETENDSEQFTPILYRHKKKKSDEASINLAKKIDIEALPTRVITRVRKPTSKVLSNADKSGSKSILKPNFLTEQEENIDKDIITENISRLKNKKETSQIAKDTKKDATTAKDTKKDSATVKDSRKDSTIAKDTKKDSTIAKDKKKDSTIAKDTKEDTTAVKDTKNDATIAKDTKKDTTTAKDTKKDSKMVKDTRKDFTSVKVTKEDSPMNEKNKRQSNDKKEKSRTSKNKDAKSNTLTKVNTIDSYITKLDTSNPSPRNTRSRSRKKAEINTRSNPEKSNEPDKSRTNRRTRNEKTISDTSRNHKKDEKSEPVIDLTKRSRRQRKNENNSQNQVGRNSNNIYEHSTVYNSSETSLDSSHRPKRSAEMAMEVPSAKKIKTDASISRYSPAIKTETYYVLFTAFPNEKVKDKLTSLGAVIVTDVMKCTVVLTVQIKRTFKLLCAVGLGKPIVGLEWVQACADANTIVDPLQYLIKDEGVEKRYQFSLQRTLSGKRNFLRGYKVTATPRVTPTTHEMKLIVECSGGVWKEGGRNWLCVSCSADEALWPSLKARGATVIAAETILLGVLQQKLDIDNYKLM